MTIEHIIITVIQPTNKITYKTNKILIFSHFYFYCIYNNIIMAIEAEMLRLLFLCHERGEKV